MLTAQLTLERSYCFLRKCVKHVQIHKCLSVFLVAMGSSQVHKTYRHFSLSMCASLSAISLLYSSVYDTGLNVYINVPSFYEVTHTHAYKRCGTH